MEAFRKYSNSLQKIHFEFFEGKEYDVLQSNELHLFKNILSCYIQSDDIARKLSEKITDSSNLYYRVVIVNCFADNVVFSIPVICVKQHENHHVFYDVHCRKYGDWNDFLSNNWLPKCMMKFPEDGVYKIKDGKLNLMERESLPCRLSVFHDGIYLAAKVVSVLASQAPDVEFLKPYNAAIGVISGICNTYTVAYHGNQLYDRAKHGQSIHYSDDDAASHWINIGNDILLFAVTVGKMKFGSPQSEKIMFQNLLAMSKVLMDGDSLGSSLKKIHCCILAQHLSYFTTEATDYFQKNIIKSELDVRELMFNIKRYVLNDNLVGSKFRRLVNVDFVTLVTVERDTKMAKEIPRLFQTKLYTINIGLNTVVDKVMQEVKNWASGNASVMQFQFRVSGICKGTKSYETVEEMCKHFHVSHPEEIIVNGNCLFEGSRRKFLELFNNFDSKKSPQMPSYIVEHLSNNGSVDIDRFKKYFNERVINEMNMHVLPQVIPAKIEWINALTLEILSYAHTVPHEGTSLVKPKTGDGTEIRLCDLFWLAKRLLGRVGSVDLKLVRPDVGWVVLASSKNRFAVIIAPKITLEDFGPIGGCYPVFKRSF